MMQTLRGMVGVNLHLDYTNSVYNDHAAVAAKLTDLGVEHVRQAYSEFSTIRARIAAMPTAVNLLIGAPFIGQMGTAVANAKAQIPNLGSFEGINEHDLTGGSWATTVRLAALELAAHVRKDAALDLFPILAPSLVWDGSHVTVLDQFTGAANAANKHPYPGGAWQTSSMSAAQTITARKTVSRPGAPVWATEWGYHTATGWYAPGHPPVTEAQQCDRLIAGLLTLQGAGWDRVYLYELMDLWSTTDQEAHFGLYRNDGTAKPAATALKRWLTFMGDLQPAASSFGFVHNSGQLKTREYESPNGDHIVAFYLEEERSANNNVIVTMNDDTSHWMFAQAKASASASWTNWTAQNQKTFTLSAVTNEPRLLLIRPPA